MTDKEVSKLNRRDLLELLLDTQTENETLQQRCAELSQQAASMQAALRQAEEEMRRLKGASASTDWQATALLKEARETADSVAASQREQHAAQSELLQEREKRLQEREDYLNRQEVLLNQRLRDAGQEAERILAEARQSASETRHTAESEALAVTRNAEAAASETLREAREAAARTEQDAASLAERLLRQAQEDSDAFWQDVNAALLKQVLPTTPQAEAEAAHEQ